MYIYILTLHTTHIPLVREFKRNVRGVYVVCMWCVCVCVYAYELYAHHELYLTRLCVYVSRTLCLCGKEKANATNGLTDVCVSMCVESTWVTNCVCVTNTLSLCTKQSECHEWSHRCVCVRVWNLYGSRTTFHRCVRVCVTHSIRVTNCTLFAFKLSLTE